MNKVDWSFMDYDFGRPSYNRETYESRKADEAWKLANRMYDVSRDNERSEYTNSKFIAAYIQISKMEMKRLSCNNCRKFHGIPMKRRGK